MMGGYLCPGCEHYKGSMRKGYSDAEGNMFLQDYVKCEIRWTRPMVRAVGEFCFDYEKRRGK
jgi:hypothetical protein